MSKYKLVITRVEGNELIPVAEMDMGSKRRLEIAFQTIQNYHRYNEHLMKPSEDWLIDMTIDGDLYGDPIVTRREFANFLIHVRNIWTDLDKFQPGK